MKLNSLTDRPVTLVFFKAAQKINIGSEAKPDGLSAHGNKTAGQDDRSGYFLYGKQKAFWQRIYFIFPSTSRFSIL
jgi:hypothetical protein